MLFSITFICLVIGMIDFAQSKKCELQGKKFQLLECDSKFKGKVHAVKVKGYQDGHDLENYPLDMNKPLKINITVTDEHGPCKDHKFDFVPYQYTDEDGGDQCGWYELDLQGMGNDVEACKLIKNDCKYKSHDPHKKGATYPVIVEMDFKKLTAEYEDFDLNDFLEPGGWYAFEITDRDGTSKLNCIRVQVQLKGGSTHS